MRIGVPKEIKNHESRVGLTPTAVADLTAEGHEVLIETAAGLGIGLTDQDYISVGAQVLANAADVYAGANLIVKVKEPQPSEYSFLRPDLVLFSYLHLAAERPLAHALIDSGCTAIAYETVEDEQGRLPLLAPMSAIAGRLSIQMGAWALQSTNGGKGQLLSPVPGAAAARVTVLGAGSAGQHAMRSALGLSADVCVVDLDTQKLTELKATYGDSLNTATPERVHELVTASDLVVGAVLRPGGAAPRLITREMVQDMSPGSVFVDISIDQGGCSETSRSTTHDAPIYIQDEVVHYCVTNMPAVVSRTATFALVSATLPSVQAIARQNLADMNSSCETSALPPGGINVMHGRIVHPQVRKALEQS